MVSTCGVYGFRPVVFLPEFLMVLYCFIHTHTITSSFYCIPMFHLCQANISPRGKTAVSPLFFYCHACLHMNYVCHLEVNIRQSLCSIGVTAVFWWFMCSTSVTYVFWCFRMGNGSYFCRILCRDLVKISGILVWFL